MFFGKTPNKEKKLISKEKLPKEKGKLSEDNVVNVYVWYPYTNGKKTTSSSFVLSCLKQKINSKSRNGIGHVAMDVDDTYISWWPDATNLAQTRACIISAGEAEKQTFEQDKKAEGAEPDLIISLYSLDRDAIKEQFDKFEKTNYGWVLLGDKTTTRFLGQQKGHSCCSMAYALLQAGGADNLTKFTQDWMIKRFMVTPENFVTYLQNIKNNELLYHPETKNYKAKLLTDETVTKVFKMDKNT